MVWLGMGKTYGGAVVNITRIFLLILAIVFFSFSLILVGKMISSNLTGEINKQLYLALGLFFAGMLLVFSVAGFKIQSQPFLLPNVLYQQMEQGTEMAKLESFLRTYKAQIGVAGFFNRLGFSGVSLGTITSAFLLVVIGFFATKMGVVEDYSVFSDLAKLLFGAFIGSFAGDRMRKPKEKVEEE
jgi:hypothetical protein